MASQVTQSVMQPGSPCFPGAHASDRCSWQLEQAIRPKTRQSAVPSMELKRMLHYQKCLIVVGCSPGCLDGRMWLPCSAGPALKGAGMLCTATQCPLINIEARKTRPVAGLATAPRHFS